MLLLMLPQDPSMAASSSADGDAPALKIEAITNHRKTRRGKEYQVQWRGQGRDKEGVPNVGAVSWAKEADVCDTVAFRRYGTQRHLEELRAAGEAVPSQILDHRETVHGREYRVRWAECGKGASAAATDTWEPTKSIIGSSAHGAYLLELINDPKGACGLCTRIFLLFHSDQTPT